MQRDGSLITVLMLMSRPHSAASLENMDPRQEAAIDATDIH